ncbi:MAG: VWA domain-containing protein [Deltaproteobacteria bacterium]|nr:VWA domain-containing protein [Deltaproteobacteria bacterium]
MSHRLRLVLALTPVLATLTTFAACGLMKGRVPGGAYHEAPAVAGTAVGGKTSDGAEGPRMNTEAYRHVEDNPFLKVTHNPLSTFAVDVDTASYSNVRRFLTEGMLPPKDAVRIEELVNYFPYDYPAPKGERPFSAVAEVSRAPWNPRHRLVLLGLQGRRIPDAQLPPRNLVFLLDVSGSMDTANKLPLLKAALRLLVGQLTERDRVAMVVYAGASGVVLPSTAGSEKAKILAALSRLQAGGPTNGADGIRLAYRVAREHFRPGGINRVILATDGDFNVGTTSEGDLVRLVEAERQSGIFLTVLGFGMGNLKDSTMEQLADKGNGNYAYIDNLAEARKVLVRQAGSTLVTIAKDVKVQVEFNPKRVAAYRLLGYENRLLRAEDFNDDRKDGGEIGAGHSVTALYEIVPVGAETEVRGVDPLKYQSGARPTEAAAGPELFTVKLRYKAPSAEQSQLLALPVLDEAAPLAQTTDAFRFASAVAAFGMLLRDSPHKAQTTFGLVRELARGAKGKDPHGYRGEFLRLLDQAEALRRKQS